MLTMLTILSNWDCDLILIVQQKVFAHTHAAYLQHTN